MLLCIYGCGGHGLELEELAGTINALEHRWENIFFADDSAEKIDNKKIFLLHDIIEKYSFDNMEFVIGVGEPNVRAAMYRRIKEYGYNLATLIHPSAFVALSSKIDEGSVVCHNAYIPVRAHLLENTLIQPMAAVGHDCIVGRNSVVAACVAMGGGCIIGDGSFVGMSASVKQGVKIGNNSVVGMGAVVIENVPDEALVVGNPARVIKRGKIRAL